MKRVKKLETILKENEWTYDPAHDHYKFPKLDKLVRSVTLQKNSGRVVQDHQVAGWPEAFLEDAKQEDVTYKVKMKDIHLILMMADYKFTDKGLVILLNEKEFFYPSVFLPDFGNYIEVRKNENGELVEVNTGVMINTLLIKEVASHRDVLTSPRNLPGKDVKMKLILVVDPHVTKQNIEESNKLIPWIRDEKVKRGADRIVFLGDQYDDFGIVHTEVMNFWLDQFNYHSSSDIALIGNHDEDAKGATSAMLAHSHQLTIVGKQPLIIDDCAFLGYIRNNDLFIKTVNDLPSIIKYVFCHAEFDGAQFEGGFYTTHGIDLSKMRSDLIFVSGHIHKYSEFRNVFYGGTPRWTIRSDANTPKGIWYFDTVTGQKEMIPTPKEIAQPYIKVMVTPQMDLEELINTLPMTERTYLDFKGPQSFIDQAYELLAKKGITTIKTRSLPDREGQVQVVSESEGLNQAFYKYASHFCASNNLDAETTDKVLTKLQNAVGEL